METQIVLTDFKKSDSPSGPREMTFGEKYVNLTDNHYDGELYRQVNEAKITCARAIDQMNDLMENTTTVNKRWLYRFAIGDLCKASKAMVAAITGDDLF